MKRRYSIDGETGLLVDPGGAALGRVVGLTMSGSQVTSLTVETQPLLDAHAVARASDLKNRDNGLKDETEENTERQSQQHCRETPSRTEQEAVGRVWAYYKQLVPSRMRLDEKRKRIIRNAIRLVGEDAVKQAVLGLSRSPHHNGQNEQRKTYLEIRYALRGIGDESDDERIEKAITWAASYSPAAVDIDPAKVDRWLDQIRYHIGKLAIGSNSGKELAVEAYRNLKAAGFTIERLDKAPWARLSR